MASRAEESSSVIAGRNPVREALERGDVSIEKVYLQRGLKGPVLSAIHALSRSSGVPVQFVPAGRLVQLSVGATHQGVVACVAPVTYLDLDAMLSRIAPTMDDVRRIRPLVVLLDEVQDPQNYGAILRSAVAAGVSGVVIPERNMSPLSAAAMKASAGAALRIPIARVGNLAQAMIQLKERGYWIAGAASDGEHSVWDAPWDRALALVLGSEGKGIRPAIRSACDFLVSIPMRGPVESLNVSVAAGIILFAAIRNRQD